MFYMRNKFLNYIFITTLFLYQTFFAYCSSKPNIEPAIDIKYSKKNILNYHEGKIEYYTFGSGKPIVLISGYGVSLYEWNNKFLEELSKSFHVVIFNNRGIGNSVSNTNSYTIQDLSDDTFYLTKTLNLKNPIILGWSMGGAIAIKLAEDHPAEIKNMVLMNAAMIGNEYIPSKINLDKITIKDKNFNSFFNDVMNTLFPIKYVEYMKKNYISLRFNPLDKKEDNISEETLKYQRMLIENINNEEKITKNIENIEANTLILSGYDDMLTVKENSYILLDKIKKSKLIVYKEAGHAMSYQYPNKIANDISSYF